MRDDLIHAQTSIDWAVDQLPSFRKKLNVWLKDNIHIVVKEMPATSTNDVVLAMEKEPLPPIFQVEAGAYLNAVRSSLDILACTLDNRHCQALVDDAYFPITDDAAKFMEAVAKGKSFKWAKFMKALPTKERSIIEALKPYKGGNGLLYPLHMLDILRKHQRLSDLG